MADPARSADIQLPPTLDLPIYRARNPDVAAFTDDQLRTHYAAHGIAEGRESNALATRKDFAALIPPKADALEIGPFYSPVLRSRQTRYFDILSQADLIARAKQIGVADPAVPKIDFISGTGDLSGIKLQFDIVLSSHCIEHQPDLIAHLRQVEALLREGGRYFLLIPDKRYCFDHFLPSSTAADILDAHQHAARVHSLRNVINHRAFTTHNDGKRHWAGDHGTYLDNHPDRVRAAVAEYQAHPGGYIDVHAWFFTPDSLCELLATLHALGLTRLTMERVYPTRRHAIEFWMVLRRT